jgi:phage terminase large subunit-like protein
MVPPVDLEPWPSLGAQVARWIEENLVYGPGDLRGLPVKLDDEKRALLIRMYEVWPQGHVQAGRRRFRRACISVRKGWAKSEFSALIAAAELHPEAPVRCIGWDGHGAPIGGPVTDPYIPMVAYTEEQSDELAYSALKVILEESDVRKDFDLGLTRILRLRGDGRAVSLAASPDARDGARTTFQVCDETHRWNLPRLKQAHRTMLANLPKRRMSDAWGLEITTAFTPGENSVAETTMEYAQAVADGKIADSRLFFFHRQAKEVPVDQGGYDLTKTEDIRAAVIEASGPIVAEWSDIDGIVEQFQDPTADRPYLCRVWLNWITQAADRAFDVQRWAELARADMAVEDGATIVLGFDGSHSRDATALIATDVVTGYQWVAGLWERPLNVEDWEVPEDAVDERVVELFGQFTVWRMYADPYPWESYLARWAARFGGDRIVHFDTRQMKRIAYALRSFEQAIKTGEVTHSGDRALQRHIGNACRQPINLRDDEGERMWKISKERPDSPHKIDAAIAACLSWAARTDAVSEGVGERVRSAYEDHDLVVIR